MEEPKNIPSQEVENKSRLKAIIETAIDGIITIDTRGIVETVNPAAAKIFGYQPEEIIGNNISMLMPEPDKSQHDGYLENYLRTHVPKIIGIGREVLGQKKDGSVFPFLLSISEVKLKDKVIFTGIVHDITGLKKAEAALRESENKINAIINAAVDGIITIDTKGTIEMVNPSASRLFGYEPEELLGKSINMLMPEPDKSRHDGYMHHYEETVWADPSDLEKDVQKKMDDLAQKLHGIYGTSITRLLRPGFAVDEIQFISQKINPDLVIMGTEGAGNRLKESVGKVTAEILKRSGFPILCIPPDASFESFMQLTFLPETTLTLGNSTGLEKLRNLNPVLTKSTSGIPANEN